MKRLAAVIAIVGLFTAAFSSRGICLRCTANDCEWVLLTEQPTMAPGCTSSCYGVERPSRECCSLPEDRPESRVCNISIEDYQSLDHACDGRRLDQYFETVREDRRPHAPDLLVVRGEGGLSEPQPTESTARGGSDHAPGVDQSIATTILRL